MDINERILAPAPVRTPDKIMSADPSEPVSSEGAVAAGAASMIDY